MREHERLAAALEKELDRDIAAITDYLAGALAIEDVHEVERRLETDPAFREIAEPIIVTWRAARGAARSAAETEGRAQDVENALQDVRTRSRGRALDAEVRLALRLAERRARRMRRRLFFLAMALIAIGVPLTITWLAMR